MSSSPAASPGVPAHSNKALRYIKGDARKKEGVQSSLALSPSLSLPLFCLRSSPSRVPGLLASVYRGNKKMKDVPEGARQRAGTITLPFNVGKHISPKRGSPLIASFCGAQCTRRT